MEKEFNLIEVVKTILKWKKHIIAITVLGAITSILVSLFVLKPYFQSFALVYPTNQSMADRSSLFSNEGNNSGESTYYGTKHDANRILSIANSSLLVNYVIKEYDLINHYENQSHKYPNSDTYEEFMKNYSAYKTDKEAIRINLIDTDNELASTIINDIVETIEYETSKPIKANKKKLFESFQLKEKQKEAALNRITDKLKNTKPGSIENNLLKDSYISSKDEYQEIKRLKEQYQIASEQEMPGIQVIEKAYPAERKIKPVRSKIVIASTLIVFFFAILGALLMEEILWIKKQISHKS